TVGEAEPGSLTTATMDLPTILGLIALLSDAVHLANDQIITCYMCNDDPAVSASDWYDPQCSASDYRGLNWTGMVNGCNIITYDSGYVTRGEWVSMEFEDGVSMVQIILNIS
ncbi:unnamed protein product, partial [Meganyctiphanes norvegica]